MSKTSNLLFLSSRYLPSNNQLINVHKSYNRRQTNINYQGIRNLKSSSLYTKSLYKFAN
jgi:hypothetical protein